MSLNDIFKECGANASISSSTDNTSLSRTVEKEFNYHGATFAYIKRKDLERMWAHDANTRIDATLNSELCVEISLATEDESLLQRWRAIPRVYAEFADGSTYKRFNDLTLDEVRSLFLSTYR